MSGQRQTKSSFHSGQQSTVKQTVLRCVLGLLLGAVVTAVLLLISAGVVSGCKIPVSAFSVIGAVCGVLGAGMSGLFSGLLVGKNGLPVGLGCGVIWIMLFLILHFALQDGELLPVTGIKAMVSLVLSAAGGMFGASVMRRREKSRYVY